jgi:hypothetical protein
MATPLYLVNKLQSRRAKRRSFGASFNTNETPAQLVRHGSGGTRAKIWIQNKIALSRRNGHYSVKERLRLWCVEYLLIREQSKDVLLCLIGRAH